MGEEIAAEPPGQAPYAPPPGARLAGPAPRPRGALEPAPAGSGGLVYPPVDAEGGPRFAFEAAPAWDPGPASTASARPASPPVPATLLAYEAAEAPAAPLAPPALPDALPAPPPRPRAGGALALLGRAAGALLRIVYPPRCIACEARVEAEGTLCGECWAETPLIGGLACDGCGAPLPGEGEAGDGAALRCDACIIEPPPWGRGRAALLYEGRGRRLVLAFKRGDRLDLARPLGAMCARAAAGLAGPGTLVAPVPLHRWRLLSRRYNQSALLAREVARAHGAALCPDLLVRVRSTRSQGTMGAAARRRNIEGAIAPHPRRDMAGRDVLLVDDVLTSGATLGECARACIAAGARRVDVVVLARTRGSDEPPKRRRRRWRRDALAAGGVGR